VAANASAKIDEVMNIFLAPIGIQSTNLRVNRLLMSSALDGKF